MLFRGPLIISLPVLRGRIVQLRREEEEEGRLHPVPRLCADVAAEGEPRGQLQDGHGRRHLPRRHQLRRDTLHAQVRSKAEAVGASIAHCWVVQLYFTQEIEVLCMLSIRPFSTLPMTSVKKHNE